MMSWWWVSLLSAEPASPLSISLDREIEDQVLLQLQLLQENQRERVIEKIERERESMCVLMLMSG